MHFLCDGKVDDPDLFTYIGNQGTVTVEYLKEKKKTLVVNEERSRYIFERNWGKIRVLFT